MNSSAAMDHVAEIEAQVETDLPYLRGLAAANPKGLAVFLDFLPMASHVQEASLDLMSIARIMTMQAEDCGTCLQLNVDMSLRLGSDPALVQAVLDRKPEHLDNETQRLVYHYCEAVLEQKPTLPSLLEDLAQTIGETALSDLALTMAANRVFPTLKRALGHSVSCSLINVSLPETCQP